MLLWADIVHNPIYLSLFSFGLAIVVALLLYQYFLVRGNSSSNAKNRAAVITPEHSMNAEVQEEEFTVDLAKSKASSSSVRKDNSDSLHQIRAAETTQGIKAPKPLNPSISSSSQFRTTSIKKERDQRSSVSYLESKDGEFLDFSDVSSIATSSFTGSDLSVSFGASSDKEKLMNTSSGLAQDDMRVAEVLTAPLHVASVDEASYDFSRNTSAFSSTTQHSTNSEETMSSADYSLSSAFSHRV